MLRNVTVHLLSVKWQLLATWTYAATKLAVRESRQSENVSRVPSYSKPNPRRVITSKSVRNA